MPNHLQDIMYVVRDRSRSQPTAVALDDGSTQVTYEELLCDVDELIVALQESSVPTQSRVAVYTANRRAMITSLLALYESDLTFAPLATGGKPGHLGKQLDAARPSMLLLGPDAPADLTGFVSRFDRRFGPGLTHELAIGSTSYLTKTDQLAKQRVNAAYLMLTSGSTGNPKAILGAKAGVEHFIEWETSHVLGEHTSVRGSQLTKPTFDAFYRDVFVPLYSGGTIVVPPFPDTLWDPALLAQWIQTQRITLLHCVPTLLREVLSAMDNAASLEALKYAFVAGEPLRPSDVRLWYEHSPSSAKLVNLYGATETVMTKFSYLVQPEDALAIRVPIGQPIPGVIAHLSAKDMSPALPPDSGELFLDIPFICDGYFGNDSLTSAMFTDSPLGVDRSIFRTGDIAFIGASGNYELLGRMDRQIKVRGIRLELDAVEAAISATRMVQDCAVTESVDDPGSGRLTAFVVLKQGIEIGVLRDRLCTALEDYAIPAEFVSVDRMPRTASGKVSRSELIELQRRSTPRPFSHFESPAAESLALIWSSFVKDVDIRWDSDFFSLGGNSLSAAQMLMRIRRLFGLDISLAEFFEATRFDELTQLFVRKLAPSPASPHISQAERSSLPSAAQEWMLVRQHLQNSYYGYRTVRIIEINGPASSARIITGLDMLLDRHEGLRSQFTCNEGQWHVTYPVETTVSSSFLDATLLLEDVIPQLLESIVNRITKAPYRGVPSDHFYPMLFRITEDRHCLVLVLHHLVADAWSLGVLWREFAEFVLSGTPGPPPPFQVSQYIGWQHSMLRDPSVLQELDRLGSELQDAAPSIIPTDIQIDCELHPAKEVTLDLNGSGYSRIQEVCRAEGITPFVYFLSVYAIALSFRVEDRTLFIPSIFRNRGSSEGHQIVGWLANRALFRVDIDSDAQLDTFLKQVRKTVLNAYAREAIPFEAVCARINANWQWAAANLNSHFGFHYDETLAPEIGSDSIRMRWSIGPSQDYMMDRYMNTHVADKSGSYLIRMIFAADLYHEETVRQFLHDMRLLALSIPDHLHDQIRALSILDSNSQFCDHLAV